MRIPSILLVMTTLLMTPAAEAREQMFTPGTDGQIRFMMPSRNIGCTYDPDNTRLSCDRLVPRHVNIALAAGAPALLTENPAQSDCCGGDIFAYGNTATLGEFICSSSDAGLVCETLDKKHGLCLSRTRTLHY